MIFFDSSYIDYSLKTRLERQYKQIINYLYITLPDVCFHYKMDTSGIIKKFTFSKIKDLVIANLKIGKDKQDFFYSIPSDTRYSFISSIDNHINDKGAIVDNMGNAHRTARSYKSYLKENDLVIKDWSDGSLKKPQMQLGDRAEIAQILNKHI